MAGLGGWGVASEYVSFSPVGFTLEMLFFQGLEQMEETLFSLGMLESQLSKANRPFDLAVFSCWEPFFSCGPKRLTFHVWVRTRQLRDSCLWKRYDVWGATHPDYRRSKRRPMEV